LSLQQKAEKTRKTTRLAQKQRFGVQLNLLVGIISNFTESELRDYEASMKEIDVYNATIAYAKREGFGRGEKAGFGRGVKQGLREGIWQTARNLKAMGLSAAQIAKATELPREEVLALK
jgi:predicted transposase/invertase (TIGR01784 family)